MALYDFVQNAGIIIGVAGFGLAWDERRRRVRAEQREIRAERRAEDRDERERRAEDDARLPKLLMKHELEPHGRHEGSPVFRIKVENHSPQRAPTVTVELRYGDDPPATSIATHDLEPGRGYAFVQIIVPQNWTLDGGKKLKPGVTARVFDTTTGVEERWVTE
jgi:hypothetical protein